MAVDDLKLAVEKIKFEALFEYASLGILVVNQRGEIILANSFLLSQFGYSNSSEVIGKTMEILIPKRFHATHVNDRNEYIAQPERRPMGIGMDLFAARKDGSEFPVEVSLNNYEAGGESFVIAFISDITKRKEIENATIHQKEQLALINKKIEEFNNDLEQQVVLRTSQLQETLNELEVSKEELMKSLSKEKELGDLKSRFVSMASHEFRTPLSTILSSASLVSKYVKEDEQDKRDKHINRIKSAVSNLTDILNDFLSIGKIEDGKLAAHYSQFNIKDLIGSICSEMRGIVKTGQQIIYQHQGSETLVLDPSLLRNVLINLLSNAIKFTPEKGFIRVNSELTEKQLFLEVTDSGIGISQEDKIHLFERFFRGTNATNIQGTGLGLHIVEKYVELMNGNIECKSELEKGTSFCISFDVNAANLT
ncbi:PAS domain-containing sensor histidine kinase [Ferruginibacter paludis]|uniref:PAS domain-containing sensor histidine kinase n=1 Tax=Ferruginibacter paludis TaxID=1310417 RepID=UPI0025B357CE|nr:PAS domain-containing sensor histidine kinase [Ferruginibacter paludis]MDN3655649.1 PAS domain-containing sensor histidine kinase [Ferruginibacter paludis]